MAIYKAMLLPLPVSRRCFEIDMEGLMKTT